jgi:XTP/dITP diphosphohydrolase
MGVQVEIAGCGLHVMMTGMLTPAAGPVQRDSRTDELLVATTNVDKLREIRELLAGLPIRMVTLTDLPAIGAPDETGRTFAENARLKATAYARATGLLTVAEDSGLEVDALGGAPGVESARFGGADSTYAEKFALIYDALRASGADGSPARFVCALALAQGDDVIFETRGTIEGRIAPAPAGRGGFGYDPIFFYPPFGCTLAEAGDRKSSVSHRGEAFRRLRAFLSSPRA